MRNLIRSPLTWMVLAEMVVVGSLIAVAWTVVGSMAHPAAAAPAASAPDAAPQDEAPLPDIPTLTGDTARGPLPGLNVNPAFWRSRLADLNRDQVVLAGLEWNLVHAGMAAARDYVETVVLPAIRRAERAVG